MIGFRKAIAGWPKSRATARVMAFVYLLLGLAGVIAALGAVGWDFLVFRDGEPVLFVVILSAAIIGGALWVAAASGLADLSEQHARDLEAAELFRRLKAGEPPERPYTLYLRPFATTDEIEEHVLSPMVAGATATSFSYVSSRYELERQIERATRKVGPLVALGEPLEHVGAGRVRVSDETWQDAVELLSGQAALIVLLPSSRPGTLWEVEHILNSDLVQRTVMIDPPNASGRWARKYDQADEWGQVRAAFSARGYSIPEDSRAGQMLFFGAGQSPVARARLDMDAEGNISSFFRKVLEMGGALRRAGAEERAA